jgi:antitoxin component YwqK of YwqJK toxin-antitoxin module
VIRILIVVLTAALVSGCWQKDVGRSYYASGKLRTEATVKNNVLDGHAVTYYENGKKMSEASYRAGVLHGQSIAYYESGARKSEAQFKDGVLDGSSIAWTEGGAIRHSVVFKDGRLVEPAADRSNKAGAPPEGKK